MTQDDHSNGYESKRVYLGKILFRWVQIEWLNESMKIVNRTIIVKVFRLGFFNVY